MRRHCNNKHRYYDAYRSGEEDYETTLIATHMGNYGDFQWHTTPHYEPPEFFARPGVRWKVTSVAQVISVGDWICLYSRVGGVRDCDQVWSVSVEVHYRCCPMMSRLLAMNRSYIAQDGDSGGPWSWNNEAYGTVSGSVR